MRSRGENGLGDGDGEWRDRVGGQLYILYKFPAALGQKLPMGLHGIRKYRFVKNDACSLRKERPLPEMPQTSTEWRVSEKKSLPGIQTVVQMG